MAGLAREAKSLVTAALILAGTRPGGDPFARSIGVAHKALIELAGQPLLSRVHAALVGAGIERIAVVADDPQVVALARRLGAQVIAPDSGPSGSVARGLDALGAPMLVTTSDHALLEAGWVEELIHGTPPAADVALLAVRRADVEAAMPGARRTWLRFADGEWKTCNLFHIATAKGRVAIDTWRQVEADRKRPWRIAARLGLGTLWSYLRGKLTFTQAVERLGERIGIAASVIVTRHGLAAFDIDKAEDLADVQRMVTDQG